MRATGRRRLGFDGDGVKRADIDTGKGPPDALTTTEREELARLRRDNKRLTRDILKAGHLLREGERVKFAFIAASEVAFSVSAMCRVLGVARSGFYAWTKRPKPARAKQDAQLTVKIVASAPAQPPHVRQPASALGASGPGRTSRQEAPQAVDFVVEAPGIEPGTEFGRQHHKQVVVARRPIH